VKLTDLRGIPQHIPQFREKTFGLAIDGDIVTNDNFETLPLDVALLCRWMWRCHGRGAGETAQVTT
jgi:hypothetical protein